MLLLPCYILCLCNCGADVGAAQGRGGLLTEAGMKLNVGGKRKSNEQIHGDFLAQESNREPLFLQRRHTVQCSPATVYDLTFHLWTHLLAIMIQKWRVQVNVTE